MEASIQARGASMATAGSLSRPVAASVPLSTNGLAALLRWLQGAAWCKSAGKALLVLLLVGGLSWLGSKPGLFRQRATLLPSAGSASFLAALAPGPDPVASAPALEAGASSSADAGAAPSAPRAVLADGRVVLNLATEEELRKLPKVGAKRAAAILALRQRLGRFRSVRDLLRVKGIGVRALQKIQPLVVVDPPPEADAGAARDAGRP